MVSLLRRLATPFLTFALAGSVDFIEPLDFKVALRGHAHRSRHTVAQDRRRAAKVRARIRAKKHGQA